MELVAGLIGTDVASSTVAMLGAVTVARGRANLLGGAVGQAIEEGGDSSATVRHHYWETAEEVIDNIGMYQTGVDEYGLAPGSKEQMQLLAVLDYNDEIFNGAHLFNMCTNCGLAFGGKLWWNRDVGTHYSGLQLMHLGINEEAFKKKVSKKKSGKSYYRCLCEWGELKECVESEKMMGNGTWAQEVWSHNVKAFGDDWTRWPIPGCGKGFIPYKKTVRRWC